MNLDAVMDEIGARLDTISGLRVYAYPADSPTPPAAIVGYPEVIYDETMRRGMDRYDLPVWVVVGLANDRAAKKNITAYIAGDGATSIKAVLEAEPYQSLDSLRVQGAIPAQMVFNNVDYLAYQFTLDVAGQGAP